MTDTYTDTGEAAVLEPVSSPAPSSSTRGAPELDSRGMPVLRARAVGQDHPGGHQGIHNTWVLSQANPVQQLAGRDYDRLEADILCLGGSGASVVGGGSLLSPGANAQIAQVTLPTAGLWSITVNTQTATGGAGDKNNVQLEETGVGILAAPLPMNVAGDATDATSAPILVSVAAGAVLTVNSILAGTAGATYYAIITATPVSTGGLVLCQTKEIAEAAAAAAAQAAGVFTGPAGALLPAGTARRVRTCDELWAAWLGSQVTVSVSVSRRLPDAPDPRTP